MPLYKFNDNDLYTNTVVTYPSVRVIIHSGSAYYNNAPNISGAFANPITLTDAGSLSLYELNVDRVSSSTGHTIGYFSDLRDYGIIFPWVTKGGDGIAFTTTTNWFSSSYGEALTGSYPITASLTKEYYSTTTLRQAPDFLLPASAYVTSLRALKNTINYYDYINSNFQYSSSARDFNNNNLGLVDIPTAFYGSQIRKGTIDLKFYITGTLIARAQDLNKNGLLIETYGSGSNTGSVIGLALYNEGFLILTGSASLSANQDFYEGSGFPTDNPKWIYFAQSLSGSVTCPSSSFEIELSGTSKIQAATMFVTAQKGRLNHSNNPTYIQYYTGSIASTGSHSYLESREIPIKNLVSSSYNDPTGSFEKITYISEIGIYDEDRNLIGIAKVATPVKKTVERDFTFKLKIDL